MGLVSQAQWSPYIVGAAIGVLVWLIFLLSDRSLGCSTAYTRTAGMFERLFLGAKRTNAKPYYKKYFPTIDWQWMLVLGVVIGAFLSSQLASSMQWEAVPREWARIFGPSPLIRSIAALIGGLFIGFGSRFAGGCTSGHGISGTAQLAAGSWLAFLAFFAGGIATAFALFGGWLFA